MKNLLSNAILFVLLFTIICRFLEAKELYNYYNVKYIDNYDGDTITVEIIVFKKGKTEFIVKDDVRIRDINTEEIRNKDRGKATIAKEQKEQLKQRLINAKKINLINCGREKYGRLLCNVEVE